MRHHPLCEQAGEGFGKIEHATMLQGASPEARIKQVQDRVFDPADILFHREPLGDFIAVERLVRRLAGETQEIP